MAPKSVTIQLAPGVSHATLPDHRKMVPGIQYIVDWESFSKLSPTARQTYVTVVSVNGYTAPASASNYPDQTSNAVPQLGIWQILTTTSATPALNTAGLNLSGEGFQGWTATQNTPGQITSQNALNYVISGPQDEKFQYVYNAGGAIAAGDVTVWTSLSARYVSNAHQTLSNVSIVTGAGVFAGVALVAIPAGYFGWIQIEGECAAVNVGTNTVAAGNPLYPDPANNGCAANSSGLFITTTDLTTGQAINKPMQPFGTALTAVNSQQVAAQIRSFRSKVPYKRVRNKN